MKKWKLLGKVERFKTPWWRVVERKYQTSKGKDVSWFVIEKKNAVSVLCLDEKEKAVLIRYYRPGVDKVVWDLPTGYMDDGETPLQAAKRELREETGYTAKEWISLGKYAGNAQGDTILVYCFLALKGRKTHSQDLDEDEDIVVKTASLNELKKKVKSGEIFDLTRVAVALLGLEKLKGPRT